MKTLLIISLFTYSLYATTISTKKYNAILITKTYNLKKAQYIQSQLVKLNISTSIKKSNNIYSIYSKPFVQKSQLFNTLQKIRHYFPNAVALKITKTLSFNSSKKTPIKKILDQEKKLSVVTNNTKLFMSLSLGANCISAITNNIVTKNIDNNSFGYSLSAGYFINNNAFFTIEYLNSFTNDIFLDSLFLSANYNYTLNKKINIYAGGLGGVSLLRLIKFKDTKDSASFLYGVQIGSTYTIYKNIDFFTTYQGVKINHTVVFEESALNIEFSTIHNLQMGLRYNF